MNFDWERFTDSVHRCRLPFLDVTVGLVRGSDGVLLVDAGTTLIEAAALRADAFALVGGPVSHIVLTHHHFDHVMGSAGFGEAAIYCMPDVAKYMTTGREHLRAHALQYGADAAEVDRTLSVLRRPDHSVRDADIACRLVDEHLVLERARVVQALFHDIVRQ